MSVLTEFHFLRPAWLLLLLPAVLIARQALRGADPARAWHGVIAPQLLEALTLDAGSRETGWRPALALALALVLGTLALAGPTWQREPAPFAEDQAAVFLVVKVTPSMAARDIQPSRQERVVQKISDFLSLRPGQRTGLIAYAGTAHLAMPLTTDPEIIETFAAALEPAAMPEAGDDLAAAVRLANARIARAGVPGTIVVLTDDVAPEQVDALRDVRADGGVPVQFLAVAGGPEVVPAPGGPPAPPLDEKRLRDAARAGGGDLVLVTPDDADVRTLAGSVERGIRSAPAGDREQWKDMGWWLLWPLVLVLLAFFRPGGAVVLE